MTPRADLVPIRRGPIQHAAQTVPIVDPRNDAEVQQRELDLPKGRRILRILHQTGVAPELRPHRLLLSRLYRIERAEPHYKGVQMPEQKLVEAKLIEVPSDRHS